MGKIRLLAAYTEEIVCLKDNFLKTLKDDWDLEIDFCGKVGEGNGDFGTPGFVQLTRRKIDRLAERVRSYSEDILVWADMDIQFFGLCTPLLLRALKNKDFVIQSEYWPQKKINTGFMAMRCNPATAALFDAVKAMPFETFLFHEQTAIEKYLQENRLKINWAILPWQFWARTHGWPPPIDIVLHHANCTQANLRDGQKVGSLALKLEQLECVKRAMENYSKQPWFFSLKDRLHNSISRGKALLK